MSPDGLGDYASFANGEVPPVVNWAAAAQQVAQPQPVVSPDAYSAAMPEPQDGPVLSSDPWPAMSSLARAPRRGMRGVGDLAPDPADRALLGATFVVVGVGSAIGATKGGLFGSIAGGLYGGAAMNAVRAARVAKTDSKEAIVSGTFAILGAGIATYLLWKDRERKSPKASKEQDEP